MTTPLPYSRKLKDGAIYGCSNPTALRKVGDVEICQRNTYIQLSRAVLGIGVRLINHPSLIKATEGRIAQKYIEAPYLFEGFKIDLRQWVLVTAYEPLEVYMM